MKLVLVLLLVGYISAQKCGNPAIKHKYGNGENGFRIVGGSEVISGSWPWMAGLRRADNKQYCGGSLIHPEWVLSAAHCFDEIRSPRFYKIALGKHTKTSKEPFEQLIQVSKIIIHRRYRSPTSGHDIALIKLSRPAQLNDRVSLICLPTAPPKPGKMCYVTGWGLTHGTSFHGNLKQAMVPIVSQATCRQSDYYGRAIRQSMLCAGYEMGGHDACKMDSGGPLVCENNGIYEQYGIVSFGIGCAEVRKPGIYVRLNLYLGWVKAVMASQ
ncbi:plasminogen-like [Tubulanus polymorphus]|uniref:plasminogen-like n=1 Tax=Tubulanus polymorphus TaxID=672921 RepID=UPI003DA3566D